MKNLKLFLREYQYYRILKVNNEYTFEFEELRLMETFIDGLKKFDTPYHSNHWSQLRVYLYLIEDWLKEENINWMIRTPSISIRKKSLFLIACCKYLKLGGNSIKALENYVDGNITAKQLEKSITLVADTRSFNIISDVSFAIRYMKNKDNRSDYFIDACLSSFHRENPLKWQCDILRHLVNRKRFV